MLHVKQKLWAAFAAAGSCVFVHMCACMHAGFHMRVHRINLVKEPLYWCSCAIEIAGCSPSHLHPSLINPQILACARMHRINFGVTKPLTAYIPRALSTRVSSAADRNGQVEEEEQQQQQLSSRQ